MHDRFAAVLWDALTDLHQGDGLSLWEAVAAVDRAFGARGGPLERSPIRHLVAWGAPPRALADAVVYQWSSHGVDAVGLCRALRPHLRPRVLRILETEAMGGLAGPYQTVLVDVGRASPEQVVHALVTSLDLDAATTGRAVHATAEAAVPGVVVGPPIRVEHARALGAWLDRLGALSGFQGPADAPRLPFRWRSPTGIVLARLPSGLDLQVEPVTERSWSEHTGAAAELPDHAVLGADPERIERFCRGLSARDPGAAYRLATRSEWSAAARAGGEGERVAPVAGVATRRLPANAWGVWDLPGATGEWVTDGPGGRAIPSVAACPLDALAFRVVRVRRGADATSEGA